MHPGMIAARGGQIPYTSSGPSYVPPDPEVVAAFDRELERKLELVRPLWHALVANGTPPDTASHVETIGAAPFATIPECDRGHPGCVMGRKGDKWGMGRNSQRLVTYSMPAWRILHHTGYDMGNEYSSAREDVALFWYMDTQGTIYNSDMGRIGSIDNLDIAALPNYRTTISGVYGSRADTLDAELASLNAPNRSGSANVVTQSTAALVERLLAGLKRRNYPDARDIPGSGVITKRGWMLSGTPKYMRLDGKICSMVDGGPKKWRDADESDEAGLRKLAAAHNIEIS
jgi:hypothetical protein